MQAAAPLLLALAAAVSVPQSGRMGVNWGPVYGLPPTKADLFMPQARGLGAGFSRLTLYWTQLEPAPGVARWTELDAYVAQLTSPDEGMLTIASASPWATRTRAAMFPSSPAKDEQAYYTFVRRVVERVAGRIRYFQADNEPGSPFYWAGSAAEYAAQQRIFYRAVKDADAHAIVVLGGNDGLFDPDGHDPLPGQEANLQFLHDTLQATTNAYDVFDLHLYGDPYTIPARVAYVTTAMRTAGMVRPIIASEYAGPFMFEFKPNRQFAGGLLGAGANAEAVRALRARAATLPAEMRLFLAPADSAEGRRLFELQAGDLVIRNILAMAAGVERTALFDVWHDVSNADAPHNIVTGPTSLFERGPTGLTRAQPLADVFKRIASFLGQATRVRRVAERAGSDVYAYRVDRTSGTPLLVAWRRPGEPGTRLSVEEVMLPSQGARCAGVTADGAAVQVTCRGKTLTLRLSDMPVIMG